MIHPIVAAFAIAADRIEDAPAEKDRTVGEGDDGRLTGQAPYLRTAQRTAALVDDAEQRGDDAGIGSLAKHLHLSAQTVVIADVVGIHASDQRRLRLLDDEAGASDRSQVLLALQQS